MCSLRSDARSIHKEQYVIKIKIYVDYEDGTHSEGAVDPGRRLVFGPKGKDINHLVVTSYRGKMYDLDSAALTALKGFTTDGSSVIWSVEPDGIKPIKNSD